jgi:hypothetical protein
VEKMNDISVPITKPVDMISIGNLKKLIPIEIPSDRTEYSMLDTAACLKD